MCMQDLGLVVEGDPSELFVKILYTLREEVYRLGTLNYLVYSMMVDCSDVICTVESLYKDISEMWTSPLIRALYRAPAT